MAGLERRYRAGMRRALLVAAITCRSAGAAPAPSATPAAPVLDDIQPDRHGTGTPSARHDSGRANELMACGHVSSVSASLLKARVDRGENIARPPD